MIVCRHSMNWVTHYPDLSDISTEGEMKPIPHFWPKLSMPSKAALTVQTKE